ncbi:MAG TPA: SUMF1/EgtB/PvdO family nonheme iron enzyme [Vicinamibacterales bacterium]|nr:SUMF1/EgtB/PvdO family nonheme iron enzyme [Vicinamibacterales bacterium]
MLSTAIDTRGAVEQYRRNRARTETIFDLIAPDAYYSRPIALRNPIVFYEGHLPAFSVIAFLRRGLGLPPVDARLERLFERGIDPDSAESAVPRSGASTVWPSRDEVRGFARACDTAILAAIDGMRSTPEAIEGLYTALEHEAMHQETLLYMWHRLPYELKRGRSGAGDRRDAAVVAHAPASVVIPAGPATLGADRRGVIFGWDNEFDQHTVAVEAFGVDVLPVTNGRFLEFMNDGGYSRRDLWSEEGWEWIQKEGVSHPAFWLPADPSLLASRTSILDPRSSTLDQWHWRGMFSPVPLPAHAPVYVSHAEASAYARWKGRRLMTEPEWHRAAEGATPGHADFAGYDPVPAGSYPQTASRWGVHELIGNGWEWTSTVFAPFAGFTAMRSYPEYSADFFDGRHYVMKGASPATAIELTRPSFRNWFRGNYPYVYAKFRTVDRQPGSGTGQRGSGAGER